MIYDVKLIEKAYKKLKSSVYFDKTQLKLRDDIVNFESDNDLSIEFSVMWDTINSDKKFDSFCEDIIKSISFLSYPKSVNYDKIDDNLKYNKVISNLPNNDVYIDNPQYFIDMNVRGHILGVLWIMLVGYRIDKQVYMNSYGNRIRKQLYNELSNQPTYSPYLFEPYFMQYESWRDKALDNAKKVLNNGQDVVVLTMDFKRFYYSVDMDKEAFLLLIDDAKKCDNSEWNDEEKTLYNRLTHFVYLVIQSYSKLFKEFDNRNILPIGFLPSNVIANWCLKNFDKAVVDGWNPIYYGRYVDDILIIDKIEKNSDIASKAEKNELTKDDVTRYYLRQCTKWKGGSCKNERDGLLIVENSDDGDNYVYQVNPVYGISVNNRSSIKLQNKKLKVYYFSSNETDALISCFQNEISKNKSEFRMMPEDDAVFQNDDYGEIFDIMNEETINKFRGVDGIQLNKYSLSKFIGKYLRIGNLVTDRAESRFEKDILRIFNSDTVIDNYTLWEKIITIFVINKNIDGLKNFVELIIASIEKVKINNQEFVSCNDNSIKKALLLSMHSALSRGLSLICDNKVKKKISDNLINVYQKYSISIKNLSRTSMRYLKTYMADKTLFPIPIDIIDLEKALDNKCLLSAFNESLLCLKSQKETKNHVGSSDYVYYPYIVNMYDICIITGIVESLNKFPFKKRDKIIRNQLIDYNRFNYCIDNYSSIISSREFPRFNDSDIRNTLIEIGGKSKSVLKIAIANVSLSTKNFEYSFLNKPNRTYKRYTDASSLVNQAISQKVDLLVMPEAYIPFEWLQTLARTCAKNHIGVITGVEHIIIGKKVFNYTAIILPYTDDVYSNAYISLHLKNHYAPSEIAEIKGFELECKKGCGYELYHWNDCYFPVYCCYELTSIQDRSIFQSYADLIVAVEWNKDVNYYSNIMESLSRDIHCYCVQTNTSEYGDSRITMPSKSEIKDIIRTKGGNNPTILVGNIDIYSLREFQIRDHNTQKYDDRFKMTPPEFGTDIIRKKLRGESILSE